MGKTLINIGCDVLAWSRFRKILKSYDQAALSYLFTEKEFYWARTKVYDLYLAVSLSGKESVSKALGTGLSGMSWRNIEILANDSTPNQVSLFDEAARRAEQNMMTHWEFTWFQSDGMIYTRVNAYGNIA